MRIRCKPWAKPELEACGFCINEPETLKGKWRCEFKNDAPLYLELGCGKGGFISQAAPSNPDINYIAVDIKNEMLVLAKRKLEDAYKEKNIQAREYKNKFLNKCSKIFYNIENWPIIAIVLSVPFTAILICILILFGQRPDEAIKAFLETSDWTLSTKISPPAVTYDAHYLCTVSLRGHKNVVKPIRMGIRRGEKIVVNRQLCIANAFEDLIQEKTPKFHHFIRHIYDKYGYPLSKHINNEIEADITYLIMKPLEWIFLIVLYLFDEKPENRIATQYIGKKIVIN